MSFTTQSASVPLVATCSSTSGLPSAMSSAEVSFSNPYGTSTPAALSLGARLGLSSAWSMRIPASRWKEFRQ